MCSNVRNSKIKKIFVACKNVRMWIAGRGPSTITPSLLVDVAQPLVSGVHQLIDGPLIHNTIRRDRGRELRELELTGQMIVDRLRTFKKGGAPVGNVSS